MRFSTGMRSLRIRLTRSRAVATLVEGRDIHVLGNISTRRIMSRSGLRIALGTDAVSIWSSAIFGGDEPARVRDFIARAFAVREVDNIEWRRKSSFGRIRYEAVANPKQIWRKLSRALNSPAGAPASAGDRDAAARRIDAGHVYLDAPGSVRIHRIGNVLSTWRVRQQGEGSLVLSHPALRNRRDVVYRLEEELASILGVEDFRASTLTSGVDPFRCERDDGRAPRAGARAGLAPHAGRTRRTAVA